MSGVIKHASATQAVERWGMERPIAAPPRDPQIVALEARVAELEHALTAERRAAEQATDDARAETKRAVAAARTAGRDEMLADEAKRLALIESGMAEAVAAWRTQLATIDTLAADLTAMALGKMFGDAPDLRDLVTRTLAHHLERLDRDAVVEVAVSAQDFDNAMMPGLSDGVTRIAADLPSGACRVRLRLGAVTLDPCAQWAVLDKALRAMAV